MWIVVAQPPAGDERVGIDQSLDHRLVGVAEIALIVDDALALEARSLFGEVAIGIDGEGDRRVYLAMSELSLIRSPDLEVFSAVAWSRVDESRTGVSGDMFTGKEWH